MKTIVTFLFFLFFSHISYAGKITGRVKDTKGDPLSYSSIIVKGTSKGVVANSEGTYSIMLEEGSYTLVCQHVGYRSQEKNITVTGENVTVDFILDIQELKMEEVIIKRGDDPAIEIIRQTIRKRNFYNNQVNSFSVDVYIKGLLRSREIPDKFLGVTIDKKEMASEGIDSTGKGILFLSESVTRVSFEKPDRYKYEVLSSKRSGGEDGLGFPSFINFYTNNIQLSATNPRGFISPISDNAFHFYKFRYEGNFFEGNRMIDRISVTPKRKNEPLFEGYINIIDDEWRIHSLELTTTKQYQLELIDTLKISQIHSAVTDNVWRTQNQVIYVAIKKFGFEITGNFLNVYNNYNINPQFDKKLFNRILMLYDSSAFKKDSAYWAITRPVPLEPDEKRDYVFRDSVLKSSKRPASGIKSDSTNKNKFKLRDLFLTGINWSFIAPRSNLTYSIRPLISGAEYNTVEGYSQSFVQSLSIRPVKKSTTYSITWDNRFGFSNEHLNSFLTFQIKKGGKRFRKWDAEFSGGKRIIQFNHDEPIDAFSNSLYTLLVKKNYMKLYENWFGSFSFNNRYENGWQWKVHAVYEDRIPLENSTDYSFYKKEREFLPNHPYELESIPFFRHRALTAGASVSWQPGQYYIQYPTYKESIGSTSPTYTIEYEKGFPDVFDSRVDFDKWKFSIAGQFNLKLLGSLRYRFITGGFLNRKDVEIPDMQHFNGNQTFYNFKYLNSFQLAPYYEYSNTEKIFGLIHAEHHFNGFLTNKIPLFNRLKWHLVAGTNTFYVNSDNYYAEVFAGLENILKLFRVDFITAYQAAPGNNFGVRVGFGSILGKMISINKR